LEDINGGLPADSQNHSDIWLLSVSLEQPAAWQQVKGHNNEKDNNNSEGIGI